MEVIKVYFDDFGNKATIEKGMILPYKGSPIKEVAYRLCCFSLYENDLLYYASVFQSIGDAIKKLDNFSCGTFTERK